MKKMTILVVALLLLPAAVRADYAAYVNSLGPSIYLELDEQTVTSGTTNAVDSSVNGNDGLHAGGSPIAPAGGAIPVSNGGGGAIQANGRVVDLAGVEGAALISGNQDFSVSVWVRPDNFGGNDWGTYFFMGTEGNPAGRGFILNEIGDGNAANFGKVVPGLWGGDYGLSTNAMNLNEWNHVGAVYDSSVGPGGELKLFVNGNLTTFPNPPGCCASGVGVVLSGQSGLGAVNVSGQPFDGGIDEFAFFKETVLTDVQMRNLGNPNQIPEPSGGLLLIFGALCVIRWWKRH